MDTVILDCDGVLLNWRDAFREWIAAHNIIERHQWPDDQYDPGPTADGVLIRKLMPIFNQTHFINKLPPIPGAIEAVSRFHRAGMSIHVITAFSNEYESIKLREKNLIDVFGPVFQEITAIPIRTPKTEFLKKMPSDSLYVEDVVKHLQEAIDVGMNPNRFALISHQYNLQSWMDDKYIQHVHRGNWKETSNYLLGE